MGDWKLTDAQAKTLREYLLRGGFLMMDDFWNADEYARFEESMRKVFPDRPVVDIPDEDAIFHTVYDLNDRYQVPGTWALDGGRMSQRAAGTVAALDGRLRRQVAGDGGDLFQQRRGRFVGVGGRAAIPGEVLGLGDSDRRQLRGLFDDALGL